MKIIYKQQENSVAGCLGLHDCYFKTLSTGKDREIVTNKLHRHNCFEMHILAQGQERYEVNTESTTLGPGEFLLLCPGTPHRILFSHEQTQKYAICFQANIELPGGWFSDTASLQIRERIATVLKESAGQTETARFLIANAVFEIIILALRQAGMTEKQTAARSETHLASEIARQFILDNIDSAPTVGEVAAYCSISTKQLVRIFTAEMEITPGEYIKKQQIARITKLLGDTALSLKEISEKMHFSSVYYFNAFFKKWAGIPPGEYRRIYGRQ